MRVLYVQYTNPGAYPPIVRGAQLLADSGAEVSLLGVRIPGLEALDAPEHPGVGIRLLGGGTGAAGVKARYARFAGWAAEKGVRWRPDWIYASDVLAAPVALGVAALTGARVIYHEHDAPASDGRSWAFRRCLAARERLLRTADVVVAPNAERAARLSRLAGGRDVITAWNCPRRPIARPERRDDGAGPLRVVYRGSINGERFPPAIVAALARDAAVQLDVVAYETEGSRGYIDHLTTLAADHGVRDRFHVHGTLRVADADAIAAQSHVGLALMPMESADENMRHMTGASNKVFEYLASGLVPIVSDLPDWQSTFVGPGYAVACDPRRDESISAIFGWARQNRPALRAIAERGWDRIQDDWNYETQFAPIVRAVWSAADRQVVRVTDGHREARCAS